MADFETLPGFIRTEAISKAFAEDGISQPTSAQAEAFEPILTGKNTLIDSATGTGKTLAYLLPLLQKLATSDAGRVVVLSPSAELAMQTLRVAERYKSESINAGALSGGGNQKKQKARVTNSTRLIVGTPGRVLEMIAQRKLKGVSTYVLDEPEPLLSAKDGDYLLEVLFRPPYPQVVVVGATFGLNSAALRRDYLGEELVTIKNEANPLKDQIKHSRLRVRSAADRDLQLLRYLEKNNVSRAIIYVNQAHLIRHLYRHLSEAGHSTVSASEDRNKEQCKQAIQEFSKGSAKLLITTDRAATGMDIKDVPLVIHYEMPRSEQAYVHRAGRSGRAGKAGHSLVFVSDDNRILLKHFERDLDIRFEETRI